MPFPPKSIQKKDDEEFECFAEMIRPVFLRTRLTDILKTPVVMPPIQAYTNHARKCVRSRSAVGSISTSLSGSLSLG